MTSLIISSFIVVIAIISVFIANRLPKNKNTTANAFYKKTPLNDAINEHNNALTYFKRMVDSINSVLIKKKTEILFKQDRIANNALYALVTEFNKISDDINDYLKRSSECIDKKDVAGSHYCIDRVKESFVMLKNLSKSMNDIAVDERGGYFNDFHVNSPNLAKNNANLSMFDGCNTQSDVKARYRALTKAFHPDNQAGNATLFEELNKQYNKKMEELS